MRCRRDAIGRLRDSNVGSSAERGADDSEDAHQQEQRGASGQVHDKADDESLVWVAATGTAEETQLKTNRMRHVLRIGRNNKGQPYENTVALSDQSQAGQREDKDIR